MSKNRKGSWNKTRLFHDPESSFCLVQVVTLEELPFPLPD